MTPKAAARSLCVSNRRCFLHATKEEVHSTPRPTAVSLLPGIWLIDFVLKYCLSYSKQWMCKGWCYILTQLMCTPYLQSDLPASSDVDDHFLMSHRFHVSRLKSHFFATWPCFCLWLRCTAGEVDLGMHCMILFCFHTEVGTSTHLCLQVRPSAKRCTAGFYSLSYVFVLAIHV